MWTRRQLLVTSGGLSVLGVAALTSCSPSNPAVDVPTPSRGSATSTATPWVAATTIPPGYLQAATAEQHLAELARMIRRREAAVSSAQARLLDLLVAAHTEHAQALASADPTARPSTGPAVPVATVTLDKVSTKAALQRLSAAEAKLAGSHRKAAIQASGLTALLWGSLAVAAENFSAVAASNPPPPVGLHAHRSMALLSDVAATQQVVAQLHAIIWGYQLAIGKLSVTSQDRARAYVSLLQHRRLRNRLTAELTARQATVPAARAAYVPSTNPTDTGSAKKLIRSMETALLPFCGLWLAAAGTPAERQLALATLRSTARTARAWGAGVRAWPGWSD